MKTLLFVLFGLFVGIFLICGAFSLIGSIIGLTFGLVGTIFSLVWKVLFSPIVLVAIIIALAYKLNKKSV